MGLLQEYEVDVKGGTLQSVSDESKKKLVLTIATETALTGLQQKMRGDLTIAKVVELAIELLLKAQNKEIRLVDRDTGKTAEVYYLWK